MTATVELTKRTALEEMIIRNNKSEMSEMIVAKQKASSIVRSSELVTKRSSRWTKSQAYRDLCMKHMLPTYRCARA